MVVTTFITQRTFKMEPINAFIPYPSDEDLIKYGLPLIQEPELLVIHAIGQFIKIRKPAVAAIPFLNEVKLSAHLVIAVDGTRFQCRPFNKIAWHAKGYNKNSIGIEVEVEGDHDIGSFKKKIKEDWVGDAQYDELVLATKEILNDYPIKKVVRHSDIDPTRKTDPGTGFDFPRFLRDVGMAS